MIGLVARPQFLVRQYGVVCRIGRRESVLGQNSATSTVFLASRLHSVQQVRIENHRPIRGRLDVWNDANIQTALVGDGWVAIIYAYTCRLPALRPVVW
jgi:hypothetical protein